MAGNHTTPSRPQWAWSCGHVVVRRCMAVAWDAAPVGKFPPVAGNVAEPALNHFVVPSAVARRLLDVDGELLPLRGRLVGVLVPREVERDRAGIPGCCQEQAVPGQRPRGGGRRAPVVVWDAGPTERGGGGGKWCRRFVAALAGPVWGGPRSPAKENPKGARNSWERRRRSAARRSRCRSKPVLDVCMYLEGGAGISP